MISKSARLCSPPPPPPPDKSPFYLRGGTSVQSCPLISWLTTSVWRLLDWFFFFFALVMLRDLIKSPSPPPLLPFCLLAWWFQRAHSHHIGTVCSFCKKGMKLLSLQVSAAYWTWRLYVIISVLVFSSSFLLLLLLQAAFPQAIWWREREERSREHHPARSFSPSLLLSLGWVEIWWGKAEERKNLFSSPLFFL